MLHRRSFGHEHGGNSTKRESLRSFLYHGDTLLLIMATATAFIEPVALTQRKCSTAGSASPSSEFPSDHESDDSSIFSISGSVEMDKHFASDSDKEFLWTLTEEPHKSRRMQILKDYPQVLFIILC